MSEDNQERRNSAPTLAIPKTRLALIEYPGIINDTNEALRTLGGIHSVSSSIAHSEKPPLTQQQQQEQQEQEQQEQEQEQQQQQQQAGQQGNKPDKNWYTNITTLPPPGPIELQFCPENPYFHPIEGTIIPSSNIILKITRRKRRQRTEQDSSRMEVDGEPENLGVFKAEAIGTVRNTVRFRTMADFQYLPNPSDPAVDMALSMRNLDADNMLKVSNNDKYFPEDTKSNEASEYLASIPPPRFSHQFVPSVYDYKQNQPTEAVTKISKSGEEYKRIAYTAPYLTVQQIQVSHLDGKVPLGMTDEMTKSAAAKKVDPALKEEFLNLFQERPVWTRHAILNRLPEPMSTAAMNNKAVWGLTSYTFNEGPFRELNIRFGFDPRVDRSSYIYQRITMRNVSYRSRQHAQGSNQPLAQIRPDDRESHVFDGKRVPPVATFQVIDLTDPSISKIYKNPHALHDKCDVNTGWFNQQTDTILRQALKRKFDGLAEGKEVTDDDLADLMLAMPTGDDMDEERKKALEAEMAKAKERLRAEKKKSAPKKKPRAKPSTTSAPSANNNTSTANTNATSTPPGE